MARSIWNPTLAVLAVALGASGFSIYLLWRQASDAKTVATERSRLEDERQTAEKRLADAKRERARFQSDLRSKQSARTIQRPPGISPPPPPSPEQVATQAKRDEARMTLRYAPFYRAAGIDVPTALQFEALLREYQAQDADLWNIDRDLSAADRTEVVVKPDGTEDYRTDPAIAALRRRMIAQLEADQIALLGEDRYRRLQEYQRDEAKRQAVEELVGDLALTDAALTPQQTRQLAAIMGDVIEIPGPKWAGKTNLSEKQWPEILARARGVLTTPQLFALKKQATRAESQAAMAAVSKIRQELREQASLPTP